jgi:hypothetical protein
MLRAPCAQDLKSLTCKVRQTRVVEWLEQEREKALTPPKRNALPAV